MQACKRWLAGGKKGLYLLSNGICLWTKDYEGCRSASGWQRIQLATPPSSQFKTFEDIKKAFADQLEYFVSNCVLRADVRDEVFAEIGCVPLLSAMIEGCIESGENGGESI